jgi:hypothetical protein
LFGLILQIQLDNRSPSISKNFSFFAPQIKFSRKLFAPTRQLVRDFFRSRRAGEIAFAHRGLQIENG